MYSVTFQTESPAWAKPELETACGALTRQGAANPRYTDADQGATLTFGVEAASEAEAQTAATRLLHRALPQGARLKDWQFRSATYWAAG